MKKEIDTSKDQSVTSEEVVVVGSNGACDTPVSFQVLQNIYNEITGKREELEKSYRNPFQLTYDDLEQLNIKINQMYEQYNIKSSNCSVSVIYNKDTKETFSSFERFKLINVKSLSETERIVINYNFLVILPKICRPQSYEIEIGLVSKISMSKSMPSPIRSRLGLLKFMLGTTAHVSIKYVDYLVARNFQDVIDEFIKGLKSSKQNSVLKFIIEKSQWVPTLTKYGMSILFLYLITSTISNYIPPESTDLNYFGIFILTTLFILFCAYRVGFSLGRVVEDSLDEYQDISYICLTRGDENLIEEIINNNKKKIIKGIAAIVLTFCLGIGSSVVANFLTN